MKNCRKNGSDGNGVLSVWLAPVTAVLTTNDSTYSTIGASVGGAERLVSAARGSICAAETSLKDQMRRNWMLMMGHSLRIW